MAETILAKPNKTAMIMQPVKLLQQQHFQQIDLGSSSISQPGHFLLGMFDFDCLLAYITFKTWNINIRICLSDTDIIIECRTFEIEAFYSVFSGLKHFVFFTSFYDLEMKNWYFDIFVCFLIS